MPTRRFFINNDEDAQNLNPSLKDFNLDEHVSQLAERNREMNDPRKSQARYRENMEGLFGLKENLQRVANEPQMGKLDWEKSKDFHSRALELQREASLPGVMTGWAAQTKAIYDQSPEAHQREMDKLTPQLSYADTMKKHYQYLGSRRHHQEELERASAMTPMDTARAEDFRKTQAQLEARGGIDKIIQDAMGKQGQAKAGTAPGGTTSTESTERTSLGAPIPKGFFGSGARWYEKYLRKGGLEGAVGRALGTRPDYDLEAGAGATY